MPLWSLVVSVEGAFFTTQLRARTVPRAIGTFLEGKALYQFIGRRKGWPRRFTGRDVFVLLPMDGLRNAYLCQLGRNGKYVSIVLVNTVTEKQTNPRFVADAPDATRPGGQPVPRRAAQPER